MNGHALGTRRQILVDFKHLVQCYETLLCSHSELQAVLHCALSLSTALTVGLMFFRVPALLCTQSCICWVLQIQV